MSKTILGFPPATWENQLIEARKLSDAEVRRHAQVSLTHGCRCNDCFCCACRHVVNERRESK